MPHEIKWEKNLDECYMVLTKHDLIQLIIMIIIEKKKKKR